MPQTTYNVQGAWPADYDSILARVVSTVEHVRGGNLLSANTGLPVQLADFRMQGANVKITFSDAISAEDQAHLGVG